MKFTLNGKSKSYSGSLDKSLLYYLRDDEGITSPKDACGEGTCGNCAVEVNGKTVFSCITKMKKLEDANIVTIEGISDKLQNTFANAFVEEGGIQCGYCIPGYVMQAKTLLDRNNNPSEKEIKKTINKHLCRCTGYTKIVKSIQRAALSIREDAVIMPRVETGKVGTRLQKYGARDTVIGKRNFVADIKEPNMLYGAIKFSEHPRAKILSIDIKEAKSIEGVEKIILAKDFFKTNNTSAKKVQRIGLIAQDWNVMLGEGDTTRYIGDVLATVIAESEEVAREAVEKIKVEYEVLTPVLDVVDATSDKVIVHPQMKSNVLSVTKFSRGDVDLALKESAFVSKGRYVTQRVDHAFMETEAALAKPLGSSYDDGVFLYSQSQGVYEDRKQLVKVLGLPEEKINVRLVPNGGGFGGKEDMTVQAHACIASLETMRPVLFRLNRAESIRMHPKRHPLEMDYELGCDANGKFTGLRVKIIGDTGAYASVGMKVLERAAGHAAGAYEVDNIDIEATAVYTNNLPNGAFRGFGVNQTAFAMESCIDDLCEQAKEKSLANTDKGKGFDRWQIRYNNALDVGKVLTTGQIMKHGIGVKQALESLKEEFYKNKIVGLACGIKNSGLGNGMPDIGNAKITIEAKDKIVVHHGFTEMGQGLDTMALQSLVEVTGVDPKFVDVLVDTKEQAECGMTTGSRGTSLVGHAVKDAAEKLKKDLANHTLDELVGKEYLGHWICDFTTKPGAESDPTKIVTHYSYAYAAQLVILNEETGKIEKVIAAHDAGKIMNPTLFEGQIEGSVHMGLGYALTEELVLDGGYPVNGKLSKLGIIRIKDMPKVEVVGIEVHDPNGPFGAKGVGEIGLVPTAGAVANAAYQFDKKRRFVLPMKEKFLLGK